MFTGIIEEIGTVASTGRETLGINAEKVLEGIQNGDSISVNGVCLTVTAYTSKGFHVDVMAETLRRTNIGLLKAGAKVNLERAVTLSTRLGGHLVQGHVDATGRVISSRWEGNALLLTFEAPPAVMRYVVEKGFIGVDGTSLTVVANDDRTFTVSLVETTRNMTILGEKRVGDEVNLEADIIAKYVEKLAGRDSTGITEDFLRENGFMTG